MVTFGVQIEPQFGYSYQEIREIGEACERLGFTTLTVSDHFMLREHTAGVPSLECWAILSALAVDLPRVKIGPLVSCNSYRPPSLLAKMAATVDVLSGGRLNFAIGAGWKRLEYDAYGYPFPPFRERVERLAEAIEIIQRMWTMKTASFEGKHYSIRDALCDPKPHQRPRPPIWVGGSGDRTLKVAARLADGVDISFMNPDMFKGRLDRLQQFCDNEGRNYAEMRKSHFLWGLLAREDDEERMVENFANTLQVPSENVRRIGETGYLGSPPGLVKRLQEYVEAGADHIILGFAKGWEKASMELFRDEVLQSFR